MIKKNFKLIIPFIPNPGEYIYLGGGKAIQFIENRYDILDRSGNTRYLLVQNRKGKGLSPLMTNSSFLDAMKEGFIQLGYKDVRVNLVDRSVNIHDGGVPEYGSALDKHYYNFSHPSNRTTMVDEWCPDEKDKKSAMNSFHSPLELFLREVNG